MEIQKYTIIVIIMILSRTKTLLMYGYYFFIKTCFYRQNSRKFYNMDQSKNDKKMENSDKYLFTKLFVFIRFH